MYWFLVCKESSEVLPSTIRRRRWIGDTSEFFFTFVIPHILTKKQKTDFFGYSYIAPQSLEYSKEYFGFSLCAMHSWLAPFQFKHYL